MSEESVSMKASLAGLLRNAADEMVRIEGLLPMRIREKQRTMAEFYAFAMREAADNVGLVEKGEVSSEEFLEHYGIVNSLP